MFQSNHLRCVDNGLDYSVIRQSGCTDLNNNKFNRILCRFYGIITFYYSFHKTRGNEPRHEKIVSFVCKQQQLVGLVSDFVHYLVFCRKKFNIKTFQFRSSGCFF